MISGFSIYAHDDRVAMRSSVQAVVDAYNLKEEARENEDKEAARLLYLEAITTLDTLKKHNLQLYFFTRRDMGLDDKPWMGL